MICFFLCNQPYVDFFTGEKMLHPLSNAPEPKSRHIPSKWEHKRVRRMEVPIWLQVSTFKQTSLQSCENLVFETTCSSHDWSLVHQGYIPGLCPNNLEVVIVMYHLVSTEEKHKSSLQLHTQNELRTCKNRAWKKF